VLRASLLAMLAGRHVLLLGPPGTAKSMLARAMCDVLVGGDYFEYLLSRFTNPDELFGPVSIPGLKDEDYRRLTKGFLPSAHIAFLDEVFKANSAILNSLLTLVNERTFHHGRHRDPVPLEALIGASNELPDPDGGLGALYDRFLVRLDVPPVGEAESFLAICTGSVAEPSVPPEDRLTLDDLAALRRRAASVEVPSWVGAALVRAWQVAQEKEWGVSDRRWRHAVEMLRVAAAAEARPALDLMDLLLLEPVLAPEPARRPEVREVLVELVAPRAVPRHDLRAQWALLHLDRVAPTHGEELDEPRPEGHADRLARRRRHAARVVAHANAAVARLAADRERLERRRAGRLWVDRLPPRVLAAHLEAGRELARVLEAAERYRDALSDEALLPGVLLAGLPSPSRREFGAGVALRLRLESPAVEVGLSLAGERVAPPDDVPQPPGEAPHLSRTGRRRHDFDLEVFQRAPELVLQGEELVRLVRGELPVEALTPRLPVWAARNATQALSRMVERLGPSGVPRPPELPEEPVAS
jgi:MoxR-like ATPase